MALIVQQAPVLRMESQTGLAEKQKACSPFFPAEGLMREGGCRWLCITSRELLAD